MRIAVGINLAMIGSVRGTPMMAAKISIPTACIKETKVSPSIFPNIIEYRETGEMKIS